LSSAATRQANRSRPATQRRAVGGIVPVVNWRGGSGGSGGRMAAAVIAAAEAMAAAVIPTV